MDGSGHFRDFERFAPVKRTVDELIDRLRGGRVAPDPSDAVVVAQLESCDLVRYRLCSDALEKACIEAGVEHPDLYFDADAPKLFARFGFVDRGTGRCLAVVRACRTDGKQGADVIEVHAADGVSRAAMLEGLNGLGFPPDRRSGCDHAMAYRWDLWYADGVWTEEEPEHVVSVRVGRTCFHVRPVVEETIEVILPVEEEHPLEGGSAEDEYWARDHYAWLAMEKVMKMYPGVRPGFSSWMAARDSVRLVKVVDSAFRVDMAEAEAACLPSP